MSLAALAGFVTVAQVGSFTRAAKLSGLDKAVLSRRVRRLEQELGLRLFNRTTRSVKITQAGQDLLDRVAEPLSQVMLGLAHSASPAEIRGTVRVNTHETYATVWGAIVEDLVERHPRLGLALTTSEKLTSLVDQGADLAITSGHLPDSSMTARKLGMWRYVLVASPEWVERHPEVQRPSDLAPHWVLYSGVAFANQWSFERGDERETVDMGAVVTVANVSLMRQMVRRGIGVTALPPFACEDLLKDRRIVRILPSWRVAHVMPIWAIRPHRDLVPPRVQTVIDSAERVIQAASAGWDAISES